METQAIIEWLKEGILEPCLMFRINPPRDDFHSFLTSLWTGLCALFIVPNQMTSSAEMFSSP